MIFKKQINPVISKDELIKFKILLSHYDIASRNIAIIGDDKKYNKFVKTMINKYKDRKLDKTFKIIKGINSLRIFNKGKETSYVHIQTIHDLDNLYFSRFE